jgi:DNA polymerase elongation subunit (family B)
MKINSEVFSFDIETIPNHTMVDQLPEPEVKYGNTKDPAKREALEVKAKEEQISRMALNPFYGRICSYAVYGFGISECSVIKETAQEEEILLISEIFQLFQKRNTRQPTIITWNGEKFDMRYLYTRAAILGVVRPIGVLPFNEMCKRYNNYNHIDLMTTLCNYGKFESLNNASKVFLGEQKIDCDVTKLAEIINSGQGDEIKRYNLQDAKLTYKLYLMIKPYFLDVC